MPDTNCIKCGAAVPEGQAFCSACGAPQAAVQPAPQPVAPVAPPPRAAVPPMPQAAPQFAPQAAAAPVQPAQGYEAPRAPVPMRAAQPMPTMAVPLMDDKPQKGSRYAVVGVWGYVLYSFVMALPIIGFIMAIVWAIGGSGPYNRRNYARAMLILWALALVFTIVCTALFWFQLAQVVNIQTTF